MNFFLWSTPYSLLFWNGCREEFSWMIYKFPQNDIQYFKVCVDILWAVSSHCIFLFFLFFCFVYHFHNLSQVFLNSFNCLLETVSNHFQNYWGKCLLTFSSKIFCDWFPNSVCVSVYLCLCMYVLSLCNYSVYVWTCVWLFSNLSSFSIATDLFVYLFCSSFQIQIYIESLLKWDE